MGCKLIDYEKWNHVDFLWAIDVNRYFNDELIKFVKNATDNPSFIRNKIKVSLWERRHSPLPEDVPFDMVQFLNNVDEEGSLINVTDILKNWNSTVNLPNRVKEHIEKEMKKVQTGG